MLAETELAESEPRAPLPAFASADVTDDERFSGAALAHASDDDVGHLLSRSAGVRSRWGPHARLPLRPEAMAVTREIVVADPDPEWPAWFEQVRRHVWPAVRDLARRIDHVGSTSVPGLAAKPIIDMDIVVGAEAAVGPVIERLAAIGYRWRGDLGVPGREAFKALRDTGLPPHHLYLVVEDSRAHLDHWLLRDLLRADPEARERYAALKRRNAERAGGDIDVYVAAKAAFVAELLTRARADRNLPPVSYWEPIVDLP